MHRGVTQHCMARIARRPSAACSCRLLKWWQDPAQRLSASKESGITQASTSDCRHSRAVPSGRESKDGLNYIQREASRQGDMFRLPTYFSMYISGGYVLVQTETGRTHVGTQKQCELLLTLPQQLITPKLTNDHRDPSEGSLSTKHHDCPYIHEAIAVPRFPSRDSKPNLLGCHIRLPDPECSNAQSS